MEGFDMTVDVRDPKTGALVRRNDYVMRISAAEGTLFERPVGSGNWYHANGVQVKLKGRLISELQNEADAQEREEQRMAQEKEVKQAEEMAAAAAAKKLEPGVGYKVSRAAKESKEK